MKDCNYNVLHALVKEQQGLYGIRQCLKDANKDRHYACAKMWKKLERNKAQNVKLLHGILSMKIKEGKC